MRMIPEPELTIEDFPDFSKKVYGHSKTRVQLLKHLEKVRNEKYSALVFITGEKGVGKTSLVLTLQELSAQGTYFFPTQSKPNSQSQPFQGIFQIIDQILNSLLSLPPKEKYSIELSISENLADFKKSLIRYIPKFAKFLNIPLQNATIHEQKQLQDPEKLLHLLTLTFETIAITLSPDPIILFVDDIHLIDKFSYEFLYNIIANDKINNLFLILSLVPETNDKKEKIDRFTELTRKRKIINKELPLNNLRRKQIENIIRDSFFPLLKGKEELFEFVYNWTKGNPLHTREVLIYLFLQKAIIRMPSSKGNLSFSWKFYSRKLKELKYNDNLHTVFLNNINSLPQKAREILYIASFFNQNIEISFIATIYQVEIKTVRELLSQPVQFKILQYVSQDNDLQLEFCQQVFRHLLYENFSFFNKQQMHLKLANLYKKESNYHAMTFHLNHCLDLMDSHGDILNLIRRNIKYCNIFREKLDITNLLYFSQNSITLYNKLPIPKQRLSILTRITEQLINAYYLSGRHQEAIDLFKGIFRDIIIERKLVQLYLKTIPAFISSNQLKDAIIIGKKILKRLHFQNIKEAEFIELKANIKQYLVNHDGLFKKPYKATTAKLIIEILTELSLLYYLVRKIKQYHKLTTLELYLSIAYDFRDRITEKIIKYSSIQIFKDVEFYSTLAQKAIQDSNRLSNYQEEYISPLIYANFILPWSNDIKDTDCYNNHSYKIALEKGKLLYSGYALFFKLWNQYFYGISLKSINEHINSYLHIHFIKQSSYQDLIIFQKILDLFLDKKNFQEKDLLQLIEFKKSIDVDNTLSLSLHYLYHIGKIDIAYDLLARGVFSGISINPFFSASIINIFYQSLVYFELCKNKNHEDYYLIYQKFEDNRKIFLDGMKRIPVNFECFSHILQGCYYSLIKNYWQALSEYDLAIQKSIHNGFLQTQAIANELAGNLLSEHNKPHLAKTYYIEAYRCYEKWGAKIILKHLREKQTQFFLNRITNQDLSLDKESIEIQSIFNIINTITRQLKPDKIIIKTLENLLRFTGSSKGAFLTYNEGQFFIHAISDEKKQIHSFPEKGKPVYDSSQIPMNIIYYSYNSGEQLLLENAVTNKNFNSNKYLFGHSILSVLCIPILAEEKMNAFLYLENNKKENFFNPQKSHILKMILSQIVISIENARLYTYKEQAFYANSQFTIANQIQKSLFPQNPNINGFQINYTNKNLERIGGDYIGMISKKEQEFIIIGDLTGHDLQAGLYFFTLQACLEAISHIDKDFSIIDVAVLINEVLSRNIELAGEPSSLDATILLYDTQKEFRYCGNNVPFFVYRQCSKTIDRFEIDNFLFGYGNQVNNLEEIEIKSFTMQPGDILLIYTDGVTEAISRKNKKVFFSEEGLVEHLQRYAHLPLKTIIEKIEGRLDDYIIGDDFSIFLMKKLD